MLQPIDMCTAKYQYLSDLNLTTISNSDQILEIDLLIGWIHIGALLPEKFVEEKRDQSPSVLGSDGSFLELR